MFELPKRQRTPVLALPIIACALLLCGCPKNPQAWTPTPPYPPAAGKDFDLTWSGSDPNGSPANPQWFPQLQSASNYPPIKSSSCEQSEKQPYDSQCSDQSAELVRDTGTGLTGLACDLFGDPSSINGHVDWTVAATEGSIGFLNFADDWDYNLLLIPHDDAGLTTNNNLTPDASQRYIEVEFDSRELADRFGTQWWQDFARLATEGAKKGGDFSDAENHLHSGSGFALGVVYGVFGLDCEHGCRSELHPAYAVAIQVDDAKGSDTWAIFARNWGDQGFCSHLDHQFGLNGRALKLLLPHNSTNPPTSITIQQAANSELSSGDSNSGDPSKWCPSFTFSKNQGEVIEIPLPAPSQQGMTELLVQLTWPNDASPFPSKTVEAAAVLHMLQQKRVEAKAAAPAEESAEEHVGRLYQSFQGRTLTGQPFGSIILQQYLGSLPAPPSSRLSLYSRKNIAFSCSVPTTSTPTPETPKAVKTAKGKSQPLPTDAAKVLWDKASLASVCSAYEASGKKLPAGEPPETAQKLDKLCSDKRLRD